MHVKKTFMSNMEIFGSIFSKTIQEISKSGKLWIKHINTVKLDYIYFMLGNIWVAKEYMRVRRRSRQQE